MLKQGTKVQKVKKTKKGRLFCDNRSSVVLACSSENAETFHDCTRPTYCTVKTAHNWLHMRRQRNKNRLSPNPTQRWATGRLTM